MAALKLGFLLFLPLTVSSDGGVTREKTVGNKPDVTPICSNETLNIITLIVCNIRTERNRSGCSLLYQHGHDFEHGCGSGFRLIKENQTVFLHLSSLTPADSGNYTCECSHPAGTDIFHLSVTVEEMDKASSSTPMLILYPLPGVMIAIIITGIILGFIHRKRICCNCSRPDDPGSPANETPGSSDENDRDEPYTSLQQPTNDLYQTITSVQHQHDSQTN